MIAIAIIIVVIFVTILVAHYRSHLLKSYNTYLFGFWTASKAFSKQAEVDEMLLFIGPEKSGKSQRTGYLLMTIDGQAVYNDFLAIKVKSPSVDITSMPGKYNFNVEVQAEKESEQLPFPNQLSGEVDMKEGQLRFYQKGKLFAAFYKDHQITESVMQPES